MSLTDQLHALSGGLPHIIPEMVLMAGLCLILLSGLLFKKYLFAAVQSLGLIACLFSLVLTLARWPATPASLFLGMLRADDFSACFRLLADCGGLITILITRQNQVKKPAEYFLLILSIVLGAHLLVMSMNFIMVVLSLELISLSSYALAGWSFSRNGAEGSLKYFLFGSVATAVMIYGMSLIFGLSGTLDFSSQKFATQLIESKSPLLLLGGLMTLSGFLFKMAAAPMHWWAPDVYQAAPTPIVAFFSVVPKLAGLGAGTKFILAMNLFGQEVLGIDWRLIVAVIAMISIGVGNFSALWQSHPKRMLAYSSVAQAGFLLVAVAAMSPAAVEGMLFYAAVLLLMNFLAFLGIQHFEEQGITHIRQYAGLGKKDSFSSITLSAGLVSLVGLPVTAGFTAKLFVFSALWEAYAHSHQPLLLALLAFGLINTAVSLFYYLRIPFYLFLKEKSELTPVNNKSPLQENVLSVIFVILILVLFFRPDLLMGWIIKVNFVL